MKKFIKKIIIRLNLIDILGIFFIIFRVFPIKTNKIVFISYFGKGYGDNPKYIAEKLIDANKNYDLVWLVNNTSDTAFPDEIRKVKLRSLKAFYELATAKVWVNNSRFQTYILKRKKQYYIQTWHGSLALKKIEYDAEDKLNEYYRKVMKHDTKQIDLMLSNSTFCTEMYKRAFRYSGEIQEFGSPRNDILIQDHQELRNKIINLFQIKEEKILLYAPTFRQAYTKNPYDIDFENLKNVLEKQTGHTWKIIIKLHPIIATKSELINGMENVINASSYGDIQELICASDLLITDYSSTMFEAMIANKPVVLYANDIENYNEERGTYFNLQELPFPLCENNDELFKLLNTIKLKDIINSYSDFKKQVGLNETGKASQEVANKIMEITSHEKRE